MTKKFVQDVIPPKRTIRNVELLYKSKNKGKEKVVEEIVIPTKKNESIPSYKYEYDEPVKRSKKVLYSSVAILLIAAFFAVSALFRSVVIEVTPNSELAVMNENFKATKDSPATNGLGFQVVTTLKDVEKVIPATDEVMVEKKATGRIVVYNNNAQSQALVKTTRFQTTDGLIFRSTEGVTVPAMQVKAGKNVAGSVEVVVEADKAGIAYNIGLKDFTIMGFKGTSKYSTVYARSKTEMTGGFSGLQKTVSDEARGSAEKELEASLREALAMDIVSQIPENFVLYFESISYKIEPAKQIAESGESANSVTLRKRGSISAVIFDKGSLSRAITAKILPKATDRVIKITNLNDLAFAFAPGVVFDADTSTTLNFNLKGEANFVWVFDENKLKTELLGMSNKNALTVIGTYDTIKVANIKFYPFWYQTIPKDSDKVTLINTSENVISE